LGGDPAAGEFASFLIINAAGMRRAGHEGCPVPARFGLDRPATATSKTDGQTQDVTTAVRRNSIIVASQLS